MLEKIKKNGKTLLISYQYFSDNKSGLNLKKKLLKKIYDIITEVYKIIFLK